MAFQYENKMKLNVESGADISLEALNVKQNNVVIVSHGLSSHLNGHSILCKELASQGYVVFSMQHYEPILLDYELKNEIPADREIEKNIQLVERRK